MTRQLRRGTLVFVAFDFDGKLSRQFQLYVFQKRNVVRANNAVLELLSEFTKPIEIAVFEKHRALTISLFPLQKMLRVFCKALIEPVEMPV